MRSMKMKLTAALAAALSVATLAGCGSSTPSSTAVAPAGTGPLKIDIFDAQANYAGLQKGWFAKIVKDKFNITLNIVSPNVSGQGQTLYNTRSAAGNLGDIVVYQATNGNAAKMQKAGLISDMTPYIKNIKGPNYFKQYDAAVKALNKVAGLPAGTWGLPNSISNLSPTQSCDNGNMNQGTWFRWDLYRKAGYPDIKSLDDAVPVLKKMQDIARSEAPASEKNKIYAISMWADWDNTGMAYALYMASLYGWDRTAPGYVMDSADGKTEYELQPGGIYNKMLKFLYDANKAGLIDPDSTSQNWQTLYAKYANGDILFAPFFYPGSSNYNTPANMAAGKGYEQMPIDDQKVWSYGCTPEGQFNYAVYLGSKAQDKQRVVNFINWLYSPEGIYAQTVQTGPKGMTWDMVGGQPTLNSLGEQINGNPKVEVPAQFGGGTFQDGESQLNIATAGGVDPTTKQNYLATIWPTYLKKLNDTPLMKDWMKHMDNASTAWDYLNKTGHMAVAPGASFASPQDPMDIAAKRGQIGNTKTGLLQSISWKAVFAKSDSEFNQILSDGLKQLNGLGYQDVVKYDTKIAQEQIAARQAVVEKYGSK